MARQMVMVGFLQAQNCTNLPMSWRHPQSRLDFMSADYYQDIGRVLERGKFHMGFFDDRLAMPDRFTGDHAHTVEHGIRCVKLDPVAVLMAMGMATSRLGLGATCSTTYYEPFHIARQFATVDQLTGGRAAWNVVTSLNEGEAFNMGRNEVVEHDARYDRADEFLEVVHGHWNSWDDDALVMDRASGRFADPAKVRRLDHRGTHFASRGPFTVPRSPQGQPVIIQAGQSGRGRRFAGRWAEVIFAAARNLQSGHAGYKALKDEVAAAGRDPAEVFVCTLATTVCAPTRAEAEDKMAFIEQLPEEIDALSLLSEALDFDFGSKGMDEAFSDAELAGIGGMQTMRDGVVRASGKPNPTVRDFITFSGRARPHGAMVGTPSDIADQLEELFTGGACDGFVIAATHVPGAYIDFVDLVVPELQRRGLYHRDYAGTTLRENLGLPRPRARG